MNNFFGEGSPYLRHPLLTVERTERELDEIAALVGTLEVDVLDVGCGFGRHAVALAARGARVTAIDPSGPMIDAARAGARAAGQSIDVAQTDAVGLDALERFDLAISLFTSFGQLASADGGGSSVHADVLAAVYRALRTGGRLLVELPDRPRAVAALMNPTRPAEVIRKFDGPGSPWITDTEQPSAPAKTSRISSATSSGKAPTSASTCTTCVRRAGTGAYERACGAR